MTTVERMRAAARKRTPATAAAAEPGAAPPLPTLPAEPPKPATEQQPSPGATASSESETAETVSAPAAKKLRGKVRHLEQKPPAFHDNIAAVRGRLPDGARFDVHYHETLRQWVGELAVPRCPVFTGNAGGVFSLLHQLDGEFRRWRLARRAGGAVETSGATG